MMHMLRMLGGIGLSGADGGELDALLRQPKHLALLAYLAMPRPGTWHRRDSLLVTFWPELDQSKARTALRSALHILRRHLADGAVRSRGDDEVSLDPALISTDVAAMANDLSADRHADALGRYAGDLLPALHIPDAEEFEKWLGSERSRLKAQARKAAALLADRHECSGDLTGAIEWARRCAELDPDDEISARRWIALLDRAGDRSQAFAVYERFRDHVAEEFGVRPSVETVALVDAVRTRRDSKAQLAAASPSTEASVPSALTVAENNIADDTDRPALTSSPAARRSSRKIVWGLCATGLAAAAAVFAAMNREADAAASGTSEIPGASEVFSGGSGGSASAPTSPLRSLVVLPMENETGDPRLAYVATGLAEGIARRLEGIGGLTIRSGARSDWPTSARHDFKSIGRQFGSTILLRTRLGRAGNSLEVRASVVDAQSSGEKNVAPRRFVIAELRDVESDLAAAVVGEIFRVPLPAVPRTPERALKPESYRLMLEGWHQLMTIRDDAAAKRLFEQATNIDQSNSRAWSGLSSAWTIEALNGTVPFDEGYDRASAAATRAIAIDSLEGTAWASLGILRAVRYRNVAIGTELIRKAAAVEPGNPEIFVIESALYRNAWLWDRSRDAIRVARRLDPLNPYHLHGEAQVELCAGRAEAALQLYETELVMNPSNKVARAGKVRALARLGRYDDAIAAWRMLVSEAGDAPIAEALGRARGDSGYWGVKRIWGQRRLKEQEAVRGWTSPHGLMQFRFESGDIEGGFRALEILAREKNPALFRLPCMPGVDVVRGSPRFEAIVARVGSMPLR